MRRFWSLVLALLVAAATSSLPAREAASLSDDPALEARVMDLAEELRCLVCQNETIAASQAELAIELRGQIRTRLRNGESRAQIVDFMVARYGEFVRYKPEFSGTTWLLWLGPFAMLALAAFALAANIRRQRRANPSLPAQDAPIESIRARGPVSQRTTWGLYGVVPIVAAGIYLLIGNPSAATSEQAAPASMAEPSPKDIDRMLDTFANAMNERPPGRFEDLEGWVMLARTYASMKRFPEAAAAFGKASALAPKDAQLLADWADVVAVQPGRANVEEARALIERALELNPSNLKALALAGSGAYERRDFDAAIAWWSKARELAPPAGEFAAGLDRSLDEARAAASGAKPTVDKVLP